MTEYNISFTVPSDGGILLDVHGTAGTSRYANFRSVAELVTFFEGLGLHNEKVSEVEATCAHLQPGESYHEKMFLPETVIRAIERWIAQSRDGNHAPTSVSSRKFAAA